MNFESLKESFAKVTAEATTAAMNFQNFDEMAAQDDYLKSPKLNVKSSTKNHSDEKNNQLHQSTSCQEELDLVTNSQISTETRSQTPDTNTHNNTNPSRNHTPIHSNDSVSQTLSKNINIENSWNSNDSGKMTHLLPSVAQILRENENKQKSILSSSFHSTGNNSSSSSSSTNISFQDDDTPLRSNNTSSLKKDPNRFFTRLDELERKPLKPLPSSPSNDDDNYSNDYIHHTSTPLHQSFTTPSLATPVQWFKEIASSPVSLSSFTNSPWLRQQQQQDQQQNNTKVIHQKNTIQMKEEEEDIYHSTTVSSSNFSFNKDENAELLRLSQQMTGTNSIIQCCNQCFGIISSSCLICTTNGGLIRRRKLLLIFVVLAMLLTINGYYFALKEEMKIESQEHDTEFLEEGIIVHMKNTTKHIRYNSTNTSDNDNMMTILDSNATLSSVNIDANTTNTKDEAT